MIAGHFGFAAMVKARERSTPLWMLMLASVWLDIVFVPLFLLGRETVQPVGGHPGYGAAIIYADYTHSFVGMLVLSAVFAGISLPFWGRRCAVVIGLTSVSHWILDLIVHRPDMPIFPANALNLPRLGFGLWRYPTVSASVEMCLVLAGAWFYWRAAREVCLRAGRGENAAAMTAALIAASGILVLWLDVSS